MNETLNVVTFQCHLRVLDSMVVCCQKMYQYYWKIVDRKYYTRFNHNNIATR